MKPYFTDVFEDICEACGNRCLHPQCKKPEGVRLERGRIHPGRLGGEYTVSNTMPLCRACNAGECKRKTPMDDWRPSGWKEKFDELQAKRWAENLGSRSDLGSRSENSQINEKNARKRWDDVDRLALETTYNSKVEPTSEEIKLIDAIDLHTQTKIPPERRPSPMQLKNKQDMYPMLRYHLEQSFKEAVNEFLKLAPFRNGNWTDPNSWRLFTQGYGKLYFDMAAQAKAEAKQREDQKIQQKAAQEAFIRECVERDKRDREQRRAIKRPDPALEEKVRLGKTICRVLEDYPPLTDEINGNWDLLEAHTDIYYAIRKAPDFEALKIAEKRLREFRKNIPDPPEQVAEQTTQEPDENGEGDGDCVIEGNEQWDRF